MIEGCEEDDRKVEVLNDLHRDGQIFQGIEKPIWTKGRVVNDCQSVYERVTVNPFCTCDTSGCK